MQYLQLHKAIEKKWKENGLRIRLIRKWMKTATRKEILLSRHVPASVRKRSSCRTLERAMVISDVWSRYKLLQGYYIIHPMGWDAFGLSG